jgi:small-conductance mechanosensitive channel
MVQELYSNSLTDWITALIIAAAVLALFFVLKSIVRRGAQRSVIPPSHLQELFRDLVKRTRPYFISFVALWAGSLVLTMNPHHEHIWHLVVITAALLQAGVWAGGIVLFWSERIAERRAADASTRMTINVVAIAARVLLWAIVLLAVLDNLGINVTALVTGLGIGGIAIALAVQNILGDLFAALSIVLDKPFVVGDAINVGDAAGTVEHIGLKSTRLRSDSGEMIIISNGDLLKSRIRNYRGQEKRLVVLRLGIAYSTPADKLARVPEIIREAAEREKSVKFDRSNFTTFGMFALVTESVYSVYRLSYAEYMNTQQRINLEIYGKLSDEGIEIAHQPPLATAAPGDQPK